MAESSGTVKFVKVNNTEGSDACFFELVEGQGKTEMFVLWWLALLQVDTPSESQRLLWSTQLALLREAVIHQLPVIIYHDDGSAIVRTVQLGVA